MSFFLGSGPSACASARLWMTTSRHTNVHLQRSYLFILVYALLKLFSFQRGQYACSVIVFRELCVLVLNLETTLYVLKYRSIILFKTIVVVLSNAMLVGVVFNLSRFLAALVLIFEWSTFTILFVVTRKCQSRSLLSRKYGSTLSEEHELQYLLSLRYQRDALHYMRIAGLCLACHGAVYLLLREGATFFALTNHVLPAISLFHLLRAVESHLHLERLIA